MVWYANLMTDIFVNGHLVFYVNCLILDSMTIKLTYFPFKSSNKSVLKVILSRSDENSSLFRLSIFCPRLT